MNWYDAYTDFVKRDVALRDFTTLRVGGAAGVFAAPRTPDELREFYRAACAQGKQVFILGYGANVLIPDGALDIVVIHTRALDKIEIDHEYVRVEAGVTLPALVSHAASEGLAGVECLAGVPGTVGGAVVMNAGGRHGDISQVVREVTVITPSGEIKTLRRGDIAFQYRSSGLRDVAVAKAVLKLRPDNRLDVKTRTGDILRDKRANQPMSQWSAGCMFINPPGHSAGQLIDRAGLKNYRSGGMRVSEVHANFAVNEGNATYEDVVNLVRHVKEVVKQKTGVELHTEVQHWDVRNKS